MNTGASTLTPDIIANMEICQGRVTHYSRPNQTSTTPCTWY